MTSIFLSGCSITPTLDQCVSYGKKYVSDSGQKCVEFNKSGTCVQYRDYKNYSRSCTKRKCIYGGEYPRCKNSKGFYLLEGGDKYQGSYKNGKLHGWGVLTSTDDGKYEGNFENNKPHGQGVLTLPDGKRYEGNFKNGKFHGFGESFKSSLSNKKKWVKIIAEKNGCKKPINVNIDSKVGIREVFIANCANKQLEVTCEFDGPVLVNTVGGLMNGLPFIKVTGESYSSKPACWQ